MTQRLPLFFFVTVILGSSYGTASRGTSDASGALRGQGLVAKRREAQPAGPVTPEQNAVRDPTDCNCDFCVSAYRRQPSTVSATKCVPSITTDTGAECMVPPVTVGHSGQGVPYSLYCLCHCQPLLSNVVAGGGQGMEESPEQCTKMSAEGEKAANMDQDANCEDPRLPAREESAPETDNAEELATLRAAEEGTKASEKQKAAYARASEAEDAAKKLFTETEIAKESVRILQHESELRKKGKKV